jgi:hypothetical protein
MALLAALAWFIQRMFAFTWLAFIAPMFDAMRQASERRPDQRDTATDGDTGVNSSHEPPRYPGADLESRGAPVHRVGEDNVAGRDASGEDNVNGSFLSQLEQRTEQVKITLANLEAQRTRIDEMIGQLQPLIPHYEALLNAERSIESANIAFDEPQTPGAEQAAASEGEAGEAQENQPWGA